VFVTEESRKPFDSAGGVARFENDAVSLALERLHEAEERVAGEFPEIVEEALKAQPGRGARK
jgi:hypothetical protein